MHSRRLGVVSCTALVALALSGCGGGDGGSPTTGPQSPGNSVPLKITTSFSTTKIDHYPLDAKFAPSGDDPNCCWTMEEAESDIASREDVTAFLYESYWDRHAGLYVLKSPKVVRVANYDAVDGSVTEVLRAIDNINAWLPWEKHLTMGAPISGDTWLPLYSAYKEAESAAFEAAESGTSEWDRLAELAELVFPDNDIIIRIDPEYGGCGAGGGRTVVVHSRCVNAVVVQHELLHLLSADGSRTWDGICESNGRDDCHDHLKADYRYVHVPVSKFPESEMAYASPHDPKHGLSQIDGETLQVIQTRESHWTEIDFDPNVISDRTDFVSFSKRDLGPWDDAAIRYGGSIENWPYRSDPLQPAFGVDWRNGMARPWTVGGLPYSTFTESGLSGTATWSGELVGFTPALEAVHGDSAINVDLAAMTGNAAFTALEYWNAGAPPGERGTGMHWNDGDLHYSLTLDGNYLRSNGGDEGYVSGRFVGPEHNGAVGILERPDLTGAFGAVRK